MVCAAGGDASGPATILGQVRFAEVLVGLGVLLALLLLLLLALGMVVALGVVLVLVGAGSARAVPVRAAIARMRWFNCMME